MTSSQRREAFLTKEEDKQARGNVMRRISAIRKYRHNGKSTQEKRIEDG